MNEQAQTAFRNWMHQISSITQELCVVAKMPFHADQLSEHAKQLHDALCRENTFVNIQHEETGRLQEWPTHKPIPKGWVRVSEPFQLL